MYWNDDIARPVDTPREHGGGIGGEGEGIELVYRLLHCSGGVSHRREKLKSVVSHNGPR